MPFEDRMAFDGPGLAVSVEIRPLGVLLAYPCPWLESILEPGRDEGELGLAAEVEEFFESHVDPDLDPDLDLDPDPDPDLDLDPDHDPDLDHDLDPDLDHDLDHDHDLGPDHDHDRKYPVLKIA